MKLSGVKSTDSLMSQNSMYCEVMKVEAQSDLFSIKGFAETLQMPTRNRRVQRRFIPNATGIPVWLKKAPNAGNRDL